MATPITWDVLSKKVDDLTLITEQIAADILAHNVDPSAHGQAGEVVEVHRSETDLDHPVGSVNLKHWVADQYIFNSFFESIDSWSQVGNMGSMILSMYVQTDAVANDNAELYIEQDEEVDQIDPTKNPFFQTTVSIAQTTNQLVYFCIGSEPDVNRKDSFGFKVVDATLYAFWTKDGAENTEAIAGITLTNRNVYRAYIDSAEEEVLFYINGVLKYTATANFPTELNNRWFTYYIKTTENVAKKLLMMDFHFQMDR